jgi:hypothetical protein
MAGPNTALTKWWVQARVHRALPSGMQTLEERRP